MGSLSSRPSVPKQPSVVFVSQPPPSPAPITPSSTNEEGQGGNSQTDTTGAAVKRTENLLRRDRSRFGTVKTSFRGLLSSLAGDQTSQKKTLLGE